jgi:hypothetical protein
LPRPAYRAEQARTPSKALPQRLSFMPRLKATDLFDLTKDAPRTSWENVGALEDAEDYKAFEAAIIAAVMKR